ncbi:hypothetical protein GGF50DRAFT_89380 [Schizophyllum commune]
MQVNFEDLTVDDGTRHDPPHDGRERHGQRYLRTSPSKQCPAHEDDPLPVDARSRQEGKPHRTNELLAIRTAHRHTHRHPQVFSPFTKGLSIDEERFSIDEEHLSIDEEHLSIDEEHFSVDEEHLSRIQDFPVSSTRISSSAICRRWA